MITLSKEDKIPKLNDIKYWDFMYCISTLGCYSRGFTHRQSFCIITLSIGVIL